MSRTITMKIVKQKQSTWKLRLNSVQLRRFINCYECTDNTLSIIPYRGELRKHFEFKSLLLIDTKKVTEGFD